MFKVQPFLIFVFPVVLFALFASCGSNNSQNKKIGEGRKLAEKYCQSCHQFPEPGLLDSKTWQEGVLPSMGPRLGIFSYDFKIYPSYKNDKSLPENFYPSHPVLNNFEWQQIIDYYSAASPDSLEVQHRSGKLGMGLSTFKAKLPAYNYPSPAVCFSEIDTRNAVPQLLLFDLTRQYLFRFSDQLRPIDSTKCDAAITGIDFSGNKMLACNTNVLNPNNGKFGKAQYFIKDVNGKLRLDTTAIFDSLARPVQVISGDLNNDSKTDFLICEFGHLTGALSWMENKGENKYERHVLREEPGAIKAYIEDVNHDGLPDIWALFTQGEEGVFLFTNKGNGQFEQRQVLRFPAINGSTYFEFADFNNDGLKDILYTCGDNADFSEILKPYHGVYIYLNEKNNQFKQRYFFPINGCFKAMARDFDNDGDLDIASIAFFADYSSQPEEGFVYLENEGSFKFKPQSIPQLKAGRWLTMDAGDLDGDGKLDLVLGNFSIRPSIVKPTVDWQKGPPFIVLQNITH